MADVPTSSLLSVPCSTSGVQRLSRALHEVVSSVVAARRLASGLGRSNGIVALARAYRTLLTRTRIAATADGDHAAYEEDVKDLLLQLFKCLLPYAPNADAVHELLNMLEGIGQKNGGTTDDASTLIDAPMQWPFALCGMLIDACANSPSLPYMIFDGDTPSTLVLAPLSAQVWPPGLTLPSGATSSAAAIAAATAANHLSVGYSYAVWVYLEPVVDSAALDSTDLSPTPIDASGTPSNTHAPPFSRATSAPMLGDIGKARPACARFVLLSLTSEDGKTGLNLTYQADTGTLTLRTGVAAAHSPPASSFSFRFGPAVSPSTYEFTNVGLIPHRWCHLLLTHTRGSVANSKDKEVIHPTASLYVDGVLTTAARVAYLTRAITPQQVFNGWMGTEPLEASAGPGAASANSGPITGLRWRWRVASSVLLDEVLDEDAARALFDAGPRVAGRCASAITEKDGTPHTHVTPSTAPSAKVPIIDVVHGCYALPSACAESLDDLATIVTRQRRAGTFASVGTASSHAATHFDQPHRPSPLARTPSQLSPSAIHEHLLAPALSSEQELLTQSDLAPLEIASEGLNRLLRQEHIVWIYHAKFCEEKTATTTPTLNLSTDASTTLTDSAHTILYNTGCSSPSICGDARLYGAQCMVLTPRPPPDYLRHVGGVRRLLVLIESCCTRPMTGVYTDDLNPATALRQSMTLLLMCLRRHPRNFRDMHAIDGYRLLGFFLRGVSGKKYRVRSAQTPHSSHATAESAHLPPLSPERRRSTISFTSHPVLDLDVVDLIFSLVGLSGRCMGGYVGNLMALEYLLLDFRLWERAGTEVQLYVFQGLINACVGNPDRAANIIALREARFVPWLLVILTNTKMFESSHGGAAVSSLTKVVAGRVGGLSPSHQELSLLNHILTLLRVLLMSELIDHELHLLANFAMTRTGASAVALKGARSQLAGAVTNTTTPPSQTHSLSPSHGRVSSATSSGSAVVSTSASASTSSRIQTQFVEMLLDVLLKIASGGKDSASALTQTRAMAIFTKSINFHWIFGVLKSETPRCAVADRAWRRAPNGEIEPPQAPEYECAILALKILLVLLESPALLQEFRSSSLEAGDAHAAAAARAQVDATAQTEADLALSLGRVISFASLSNLLLPYATCARVYPILLCLMLGKSIHHLTMLPSELSVDTLDDLFHGLHLDDDADAHGSVTLVVPEVVDILVDLLSRCLHLLSEEQQIAFESDPAGFFSAAAAVAAFVPPTKPQARVYSDIYATGVLSAPPPTDARKSKFGIDHSRWNTDREDRLDPITRDADVVKEVMAELGMTSELNPLQSAHSPAVQPRTGRPNPLGTETPETSPQHAAAGSPFPFGGGAIGVAPPSPSTALLNGLVLFFMRLLHVCEDFGRVVSRSTFLRPCVAALFASAHLNPIVTLAAPNWQAQPHQPHANSSHAHMHPPRPASAQSLRVPPAHLSHGPHSTSSRPNSSLGMSAPAHRHSHSLSLHEFHPPPASPEAVTAGPFSPDSAAAFSSAALSPDSAQNPLTSPSSAASFTGIFSPTADSIDSRPSASPPTVMLSSMDLSSPQSRASDSPANLNVLTSPQYLAFQQAQIGSLAAPPSPPGSPTTRRRIFSSAASTTTGALQLTIDAASTPTASQLQALFHEQLSARSASPTGDHTLTSTPSTAPSLFGSPSGNGPLVYDSAFCFESEPSADSHPSDPAAAVHSSIRIPIFRHSTSQLLLRFLRQIVLYHVQYKKDGWMILEKVLDSFPSSMRAPIGRPADTSDDLLTLQQSDELVKGFQSALLSILLVRIQEDMSSSVARSTNLLVTPPATTATAAAPSPASPTKYLTSLARIVEVIFLKIQCGTFLTRHWRLDDAPDAPPSNAGSTVGLLRTLLAVLKHGALRASIEDLAAASVALQAKSHTKRKSTYTTLGGSSGGSGSGSGAFIAVLTAAPIRQCLRTLQDIAAHCVLHLYDQFTMKEMSMREVVHLNQYVHRHRRIFLGEYLLSAHVSGYISSSNALVGGPAAALSPMLFSARSYVCCMMYHLYNFQLNVLSPEELEQEQRDERESAAGARTDSDGDLSMPPSLSPSSQAMATEDNAECVNQLKHSALALLICLIRSKPALLSELMRVSISHAPGTEVATTTTSITYDLYNNGFDVLLRGFNLSVEYTTPSASPRSAEAEGFFAWLAIQRPIISSVFSRTLLPEWRAYCKFLNGFLYLANDDVDVRVRKMAERDAENGLIDGEEIGALHVGIERLLQEASQVDSDRYLRRIQTLVEQDASIKSHWRETKQDVTRLYAMYSDSRRLYKDMPRRDKWARRAKRRASAEQPTQSTQSRKGTATSDSGVDVASLGVFVSSSSESESDSDSDSELLISPLEHTWQQRWQLDPIECVSRVRVRLTRSVLAHPHALAFTFPYKREADELREAREAHEAFMRRQSEALAARKAAASVPLVERREHTLDVVTRVQTAAPATTAEATVVLPEDGSVLPELGLVQAVNPTPIKRNSDDRHVYSDAPNLIESSVALLPIPGDEVAADTSTRPHARRASTISIMSSSSFTAEERADLSQLASLNADVSPLRIESPPPSLASATGKLVPESSDRPAPMRRVKSFAMTPHSLSSFMSPAIATDRKRKANFFGGGSGGSSRNLLATPRVPPGGSPRAHDFSPSTSPNSQGGPLHLHGQPASFRRAVSFSQEFSVDDASDISTPHHDSLISPQSATRRADDVTLLLPSPPALQADTPDHTRTRGAHASFLTPPAARDALPDVSEHSDSNSTRGSLSGQQPTDLAEEEISDSITFDTPLLTEEYTWFLYEERLRLLLDGSVINYHYNCLRIQGLEEVSAILLLCTNAIFIVDQYQVNPDGTIVRLEANHAETGEKNKLVVQPDAASMTPSSCTSRRWSYTDIISVHKRRYLLRPAALELFSADQSNYLLVVNIKQRELIYNNLLTLCPNITDGNSTEMHANTATNQASGSEMTTNAHGIGLSGGGTLTRDAAARLSTDGLQVAMPNSAGVGLGVGIGGLTAHAAEPPAVPPAATGGRLSSNFSSLFFTNHTLATEGAIAHLSSVVSAVLDAFTVEWQHGFLSNFDYLMLLSSFSGRSFNDLTQYPVFPWVIADYDSSELDLHDARTFRDLSKPMGALDETRAAMHRQKYKETEALWRDEEREVAQGRAMPGHGGTITTGVSRAYHYSTHYSSAAVVMYYLLRLEPYTQHLITFQSGRFDRADRLFSSVKQTFLTASKLSGGDVKELIPEFFYLPSMMRNGNQLELGHRQDGRVVGDVLLPPWAKGSPREFIRLHRLALESEHVSAHLHLWIDLVYGRLQTGDAAVRAINVFHYVTYAGNVNIDSITDPVLRRGMIEAVRSFGQTPAALFTKAHPPRLRQPRAGRIVREPHTMQPTDTARFPHAVSQIFCVDRTMLLGGVASSTPDRLLVAHPRCALSVPSLQAASSFLPYAHLVNPPCVSPRNVRLSKSYRSSACFNKASMLEWGLPDGTLRTGLVDIGAATSGGLDAAASIDATNRTNLGASGPSVRSLKAYFNLHDGAVRIACVPLEGDDGTLVTGGDDGLVCVWQRTDLGVGDDAYLLAGELAGHRRPITAIVACKSFGIIASGSEDGAVILWDIVRLHAIRTLRFSPRGATITHIAVNMATGDITTSSSNPDALYVIDINGNLLARYPDPRAIDQPDAPEALRRDAPMDAVTSLAMPHTIGHRDPLSSDASAPRFDTSALVLTGHASGVIRLWYLRWLSFRELFAAVDAANHAAEDTAGRAAYSAPPIVDRVNSLPSDIGLGPPLVRSRSGSFSTPTGAVSLCTSDADDRDEDGEDADDASSEEDEVEQLFLGDSTPSITSRQLGAELPTPFSPLTSPSEATDTDVDTPVTPDTDPVVALQASQTAAHAMSSLVFGSPGEEQIADAYTANGAQARARQRAIKSATAPAAPALVAPPRIHRQWHLVCVGELLGHQVPVTALSLTRDGGTLYSGDANGNVVHFTPPEESPRVGAPCTCKPSRSRARIRLFQTLSCGAPSSSVPPPQRIKCASRDCTHVGCEFCHLDHVRAAHPSLARAKHATADASKEANDI